MRVLSDLIKTLASTFGIGQATLNASGLTANRNFTLPDASGTLALSGGGGGGGIASVNFGAGGSDIASVDIVGQTGITTSSVVLVGIALRYTADHYPDDAMIEEMDIRASVPSSDTGFTIYAISRKFKLYGVYDVYWRWF